MKLQALPRKNVVGRALRLLDALGQQFRVNLGSLCATTGLSKPTAHRILSDLVVAGLVVQDGSHGEYRLTASVARLGARVDDRAVVLDCVSDACRALTLQRLWPIAVGFLQHDAIVVSFSTRQLAPLKLKPTTLYEKLPLVSALGQAALATLSEPELKSHLDRLAANGTARATITEIARKVRAAQCCGFGLRIKGREGASSIAVGFNFGGTTAGAVVATVFEKFVTKELITLLAQDLTQLRYEAEIRYREIRQNLIA